MTCQGFARAPHHVHVLASADWPLCHACMVRAEEWQRYGRPLPDSGTRLPIIRA